MRASLAVAAAVAVLAPCPCSSFMTGSGMVMQAQGQQQQGQGAGAAAATLKKVVAGFAALSVLAQPCCAFADEIGVFKTEELVKNPGTTCIKRSPVNGRCEQYSDEPAALSMEGGGRSKLQRIKPAPAPSAADAEESDLVRKLKQKTLENKAKNEAMVAEKSFMNSQAGEFGPFSRYVLIKRPDNRKYELVLIRDVDGLQRKGIIDESGKSFVPGREPLVDAVADDDAIVEGGVIADPSIL